MFCAKNYGTASTCVKVIHIHIGFFFPDTVHIVSQNIWLHVKM